MKKILYLFLILLPLKADLGPIRFAGKGNSIIATCTITVPGNYSLARSFTGSITIAADDVSLDLLNHQIFGSSNNITIDGNSRIEIMNGSILNATGNGVFINNARDISISQIDFVGNVTGVMILTSSQISLENLSFSQHQKQCIIIQDSNNVTGANISCIFNTAGFVGSPSSSLFGTAPIVGIGRSQNCSFSNLAINDNNGTLFNGVAIKQGQGIQLINCKIQNNEASDQFALVDIETCVDSLINTVNINNNTGLSTTSSQFVIKSQNSHKTVITDSIITNNTANLNIDGTGSSDRLYVIFISTDTNSCIINNIIKENSAVNGRVTGINVFNGSTRIVVEKNLVTSNFGNDPTSTPLFTLGIVAEGPSGPSNDCVVFANQVYTSIGLGGTNNFSRSTTAGVLLNVPTIHYDISANTMTFGPGTPTDVHNISIEP